MRKVLLAVLLVLPLTGCALPPALSIATLMMDAGSYAASGKLMTDHGISIVAERDCALFNIVTEGALCREEQVYETALAALEPLPGTAPDLAVDRRLDGQVSAAPFLSDGLPRNGTALLIAPRPAAAFLADGDLRRPASSEGG